MKKIKSDEEKTAVELLREKVGKTQFQVAIEVKVTDRAVRAWENQGSIPGLDKAIALARCYNVSLKELSRAFGLSVDNLPDDVPRQESASD